ncbi:conserved hypothetical protein [Neospora caninum Liverpool]|nr:conserved hypothetical protein [Neospora caninum Liverpool]CBZ52045.1 conserved hypothetical protein [Neospora caninum Liverpool]|eukprot:XP_003882077.1 conserved hypothetical protein [Neospora caninum Liverpool]
MGHRDSLPSNGYSGSDVIEPTSTSLPEFSRAIPGRCTRRLSSPGPSPGGERCPEAHGRGRREAALDAASTLQVQAPQPLRGGDGAREDSRFFLVRNSLLGTSWNGNRDTGGPTDWNRGSDGDPKAERSETPRHSAFSLAAPGTMPRLSVGAPRPPENFSLPSDFLDSTQDQSVKPGTDAEATREAAFAASTASWNDEGDDFVTPALLQGGECSRAQLAHLEEIDRKEEAKLARLMRLQQEAMTLAASSPSVSPGLAAACDGAESELLIVRRFCGFPPLRTPEKEDAASSEHDKRQTEAGWDGARDQRQVEAEKERCEQREFLSSSHLRHAVFGRLPAAEERQSLHVAFRRGRATKTPALQASLAGRDAGYRDDEQVNSVLTAVSTKSSSAATKARDPSVVRQTDPLCTLRDSNNLALFAAALARTLAASPRVSDSLLAESREKDTSHSFAERGEEAEEETDSGAGEDPTQFASDAPQTGHREKMQVRNLAQETYAGEAGTQKAGDGEQRTEREAGAELGKGRLGNGGERPGPFPQSSFLDSWLRLCAADPLFQCPAKNRFSLKKRAISTADGFPRRDDRISDGHSAASPVRDVVSVPASPSRVRARQRPQHATCLVPPLSRKQRGPSLSQSRGKRGMRSRARHALDSMAGDGSSSVSFPSLLSSRCQDTETRGHGGTERTSSDSDGDVRIPNGRSGACCLNLQEGCVHVPRRSTAADAVGESKHLSRIGWRNLFACDRRRPRFPFSPLFSSSFSRTHSATARRFPPQRETSWHTFLLPAAPPPLDTPHLHLHLSHVTVASRLSPFPLGPAARLFLCCSVPVSVVGVLSTAGRETGRVVDPDGLRRLAARGRGEEEGEPLVEEDLVTAHCVKRESRRFLFDCASCHALRLGPPSPALARAVLRVSRRNPGSSSAAPALLSEAEAASVLLRQPIRFLLCASTEPRTAAAQAVHSATAECVREGRAGGFQRARATGNSRALLGSRQAAADGRLERQTQTAKDHDRLALWGWTHSFPADPTVSVLAVGTLETWSGALLTHFGRNGDTPHLSLAVQLHAPSCLELPPPASGVRPGRASIRAWPGEASRASGGEKAAREEELENADGPRRPEVKLRARGRQVEVGGKRAAQERRPKLPVATLHISIACTGGAAGRNEPLPRECRAQALRRKEGEEVDGDRSRFPFRGNCGRMCPACAQWSRSEEEDDGERVDEKHGQAGTVGAQKETGREDATESNGGKRAQVRAQAATLRDVRKSMRDASGEGDDRGGPLLPSVPPMPHAVPHLEGDSSASSSPSSARSCSSPSCSVSSSSSRDAAGVAQPPLSPRARQAFLRPLHLLVHVGEFSVLDSLRRRLTASSGALDSSPRDLFCACKLGQEQSERSRLLRVFPVARREEELNGKRNATVGDEAGGSRTTHLAPRSHLSLLSARSQASTPNGRNSGSRQEGRSDGSFHFTALSELPFFWPSRRTNQRCRGSAASALVADGTRVTPAAPAARGSSGPPSLSERNPGFDASMLASDAQPDEALSPERPPAALWTCRRKAVVIEFWATSCADDLDSGSCTDTRETARCPGTPASAGAAETECLGFLTCDVAGAIDRVFSVSPGASSPRSCLFVPSTSRTEWPRAETALTNRGTGESARASTVFRQPAAPALTRGIDFFLLDQGDELLRDFAGDHDLARCRVALYAGPKEALEKLAALLAVSTETQPAFASGNWSGVSSEGRRLATASEGAESESADPLLQGRKREGTDWLCSTASKRQGAGDRAEGRRTEVGTHFGLLERSYDGIRAGWGDRPEREREGKETHVDPEERQTPVGVHEEAVWARRRLAVEGKRDVSESEPVLRSGERKQGDATEEKRPLGEADGLPASRRAAQEQGESPKSDTDDDRRTLLETIHRRLLRDSLRGNDVWPVCWQSFGEQPPSESESEGGNDKQRRERETGGASAERRGEENRNEAGCGRQAMKKEEEGNGEDVQAEKKADAEVQEGIEHEGIEWGPSATRFMLEQEARPPGGSKCKSLVRRKTGGRSKEHLRPEVDDSFVHCNLVCVRLASFGFARLEAAVLLDRLTSLSARFFPAASSQAAPRSSFSSLPFASSSVPVLWRLLVSLLESPREPEKNAHVLQSPSLKRVPFEKPDSAPFSLCAESASSRPLSGVSTAAPSPTAEARRRSEADEQPAETSSPRFSGSTCGRAALSVAFRGDAKDAATLCPHGFSCGRDEPTRESAKGSDEGVQEPAASAGGAGRTAFHPAELEPSRTSFPTSSSFSAGNASSRSFFCASRVAASSHAPSASSSGALSVSSGAIFIPLLHAYIEAGRQLAQLWALQALHPELVSSVSPSFPFRPCSASSPPTFPAVSASAFFPSSVSAPFPGHSSCAFLELEASEGGRLRDKNGQDGQGTDTEEDRRAFCRDLVQRTKALRDRALVAGRASVHQLFSRLRELGLSEKDIAVFLEPAPRNGKTRTKDEQERVPSSPLRKHISLGAFERGLSRLLASPGHSVCRRSEKGQQESGDAGDGERTRCDTGAARVGDSSREGRRVEASHETTLSQKATMVGEMKDGAAEATNKEPPFQLDRRRSQTLLVRLAGLYLALCESQYQVRRSGEVRDSLRALWILHLLVEISTAVARVSAIASASSPLLPSHPSLPRTSLHAHGVPWTCRCSSILLDFPSSSSASAVSSSASDPPRFRDSNASSSCEDQPGDERGTSSCSDSQRFFSPFVQVPSSLFVHASLTAADAREAGAARPRLHDFPVISTRMFLRGFSAFCRRDAARGRETREATTRHVSEGGRRSREEEEEAEAAERDEESSSRRDGRPGEGLWRDKASTPFADDGMKEKERSENDAGEEQHMQAGRTEVKAWGERKAKPMAERRETAQGRTQTLESTSQHEREEKKCRNLRKREETQSVRARAATQTEEREATLDKEDKAKEPRKAEDNGEGRSDFVAEDDGFSERQHGSHEAAEEEGEQKQEGNGKPEGEKGSKWWSEKAGEDREHTEREDRDDEKETDAPVASVTSPLVSASCSRPGSSSRQQGRQVAGRPTRRAVFSRRPKATFHRSECRKCARKACLEASAVGSCLAPVAPSSLSSSFSFPPLSSFFSGLCSRTASLNFPLQGARASASVPSSSLSFRSGPRRRLASLPQRNKERYSLSLSSVHADAGGTDAQGGNGKEGDRRSQEEENEKRPERDEQEMRASREERDEELGESERQTQKAWTTKIIEDGVEPDSAESAETDPGKEACIGSQTSQKKELLTDTEDALSPSFRALGQKALSVKRVTLTPAASRFSGENAAGITYASFHRRPTRKGLRSVRTENELTVSLRVPALPPPVRLPAFVQGPETPGPGAKGRQIDSKEATGA